jgi:predicted RecA/RadA family phage recombinase
MPLTTYKAAGSTVEHVASGAIAYGDVVSLVTRIGIAAADIANGATGALDVVGVFEMPANNNLVIAVGDAVYWDVADQEINKTAQSNIPAGWAVEAKAQTGTTVLVKIG